MSLNRLLSIVLQKTRIQFLGAKPCTVLVQTLARHSVFDKVLFWKLIFQCAGMCKQLCIAYYLF